MTPPRTVLALDPSIAQPGVALACGEQVLAMSSRRLPPKLSHAKRCTDFTAWVARWLDEHEPLLPLRQLVLAVEVPPPTARQSTRKERRGQTTIGWALGRVTGRLEGALGLEAVDVPVSEWRVTRDRLRARLAVQTPRLHTPGAVRYHRAPKHPGMTRAVCVCGWEQILPAKRILQDPPTCPNCGAPKAQSDAAARTEREKARAVQLVRRMAPDVYEAFVGPARKRARRPEVKGGRCDWRVTGVSDACEAAVIAVHVSCAG